MPYVSESAVELLRELAVEVRALRAIIEADRAGIATGSQAAMTAAVFAVVGLRVFVARELAAMAQRPGIPEAALRALLAGRSHKAIGQALAECAGRPCADLGLVLVRGKEGRSGWEWQVCHTSKAASR